MSSHPFSEEQIREEVRLLVAALTERSPEEVTDTANFITELGIDSLMAIEMLVALDRRFGIDIPEPEFNRIKDVNETVTAVQHYLASRQSSD